MRSPPERPDWVWGVEEDKPDDDNGANGEPADDDGEDSGGGVEGRSPTQ